MAKPEILQEEPISMVDLKQELVKIKERDKELRQADMKTQSRDHRWWCPNPEDSGKSTKISPTGIEQKNEQENGKPHNQADAKNSRAKQHEG